MVQPQALNVNALPTAVCWTGGKDCNLALLAAWRDPSLNVVVLVVFRPEDAQFKAHPLRLMEEQADCLGLPLRHIIIPRDTPSYKEAYISGIGQLGKELGIRVIATGDMDLVGDMSRNWIEECAEACVPPIRVFLPLSMAGRSCYVPSDADRRAFHGRLLLRQKPVVRPGVDWAHP